MKVYVYPADVFGCGFYRLIWPAQVLANQGHDVVIILPGQRYGIYADTNPITRKLNNISAPADADVMVVQRPTHRNLPQMVKIFTDNGIAVVIDMDDDLSRVDAQHPAFTNMHPSNVHLTDHSWTFAEEACDRASMIVVSTDALLRRYAKHGRGVVIRNCVPESYLNIPHYDNDVLGWGGSVQSHPNDLQVMGGALSRLARDYHAPIRFVGPSFQVKHATGLTDDEFVATGSVELNTWPTRMSELGVGFAPLADTEFNRAKSWLKPLEFAALGVPCVMSPRDEYVRLHKLGVGWMAKNPNQWYGRLKRLYESESERVELSESGREAVRELTYEKQAYQWWEAWSQALVNARRMYRSPLMRR